MGTDRMRTAEQQARLGRWRPGTGVPLLLVLMMAALPAVAAARPVLAGRTHEGERSAPALQAPAVVTRWHARLRLDRQRAEAAYRGGRPLVADVEYDALATLVAGLEAAWPALGSARGRSAALGERVADEGDRGPPMGSLVRLVGAPALASWVAELGVLLGRPPPGLVLEPKLDGVALELVYEQGRLVSARTRGDGRRGRLVTDHLARTRGVPRRLAVPDPPPRLDVRGELVIRRDDLRRYAAACAGPPPVDGRSLVAGSLALADPAQAGERPLSFVAHGLGRARGVPFEDQAQLLEALQSFGFETLAAWQHAGDAEALWRAHQQLEADRDELPWACDGTVVKLVDLGARERLGWQAGGPRWARALKFAGRRASTVVTGLDWTVGRSGRLTPVAELEPVRLGGALVSRVSLHGAGWLERVGLRVGDRVLVERAGGTIPVVLGVVVSGGGPPPTPLRTCPRCAVALTDGRCLAPDCPAVLARRLEHLASDQALDIEGLGPALAGRLVAAGLVRQLADVFRLQERDLCRELGWTGTRAQALLRSVERTRQARWSRWLVGLGLPGVGPVTARALARACPDATALWQAGREQLLAVPGVGPVLADELVALAEDPLRRARAQALLDHARAAP